MKTYKKYGTSIKSMEKLIKTYFTYVFSLFGWFCHNFSIKFGNRDFNQRARGGLEVRCLIVFGFGNKRLLNMKKNGQKLVQSQKNLKSNKKGTAEARAPPFLFRTFSITLLIVLALDQFLINFFWFFGKWF